MELKQISTTAWNLMDGSILPLFHDYVKDYIYLEYCEIITSQAKRFGKKKVYSGEGYATSLGWDDILPVILQNYMNADNFFILFQGRNLQAWFIFYI